MISPIGSQYNSSYISALFPSYGGGLKAPETPVKQPGMDMGLYGVNLAQTPALTKQQMTAVKQDAAELAKAASALNDKSMFGQLTTVRPDGTVAPAGEAKAEVSQLATAQKNIGAELKADEQFSMFGKQEFTVKQDGKETALSINVTSADTNRSVMQKVADAINGNKDMGISVKVDYDGTTGKASIVFSGKSTGGNNAFSFNDANGGSLVSVFDMNNLDTRAQDARYTLDGKAMSSSTNTVDLGGGAKGVLDGLGTKTFTLYNDTEAAKGALGDFLSSYNKLMKTADVYGSEKLQERLKGAYGNSSEALAKLGVYTGIDGSLRMNDQLVDKSLADGSLEKAMGIGSKTGFVGMTDSAAKAADQNPAQFAGPNASKSFNTFNSLYDMSFKQMAYSMMAANVGQLFNYLI